VPAGHNALQGNGAGCGELEPERPHRQRMTEGGGQSWLAEDPVVSQPSPAQRGPGAAVGIDDRGPLPVGPAVGSSETPGHLTVGAASSPCAYGGPIELSGTCSDGLPRSDT